MRRTMIVYGDRERSERTSASFARLERRLSALEVSCDPQLQQPSVEARPAAHRRNDAAELAIECGMLVQALLDHEFGPRGYDELSPVHSAGARLCLAAGAAFARGELKDVRPALTALRSCAPEDAELRLREPEGYAFYALYPDLYCAAARAFANPDKPVQVIGIRSIGTSLAAFVAAALDSVRPAYTVRPIGHPFARELHVGPALERALLERRDSLQYIVVDEGPGLSGSSFVAVANWLIARGVPSDQIALFPSHGGEPGAASAPALRDRYRSLARYVVPFEQVFDEGALRSWFPEHLLGPGPYHLSDLSGGRWRALFYPRAESWPPSQVRDERRKYLLHAGPQSWLIKYVGLGERAQQLGARAQLLSQHGFTPELRAAHYGMALFRFHAEGTPLPLARAGREALIAQLARYLAFLAERFRVPGAGAGATPDELLTLAKHNSAELLGPERADALARFDALLPRLRDSHDPMTTDNKLDPCEWLALPDGRWLKCDAEAHHAGHDCIGCQDPAWDVAGATIELALSEAERELVIARLRDQARVRIDGEKLAFFELAYAAFRAGSAHFAELALHGVADEEAARWHAEKARYAAEIARRLGPSS